MTLLKTATGRRCLKNTILIVLLLWIIISLFKFLWFHSDNTSFTQAFIPTNDHFDMLIRLLFSSMIIISGGIFTKLYIFLTEAKERSREQALQLHTTLNSISDGVIATDEQGRITSMNAAAEQMTGRQADSSLGQTIESLFTTLADNSSMNILKDILSDKSTSISKRMEILKEDNQKATLDISGSAIINDRGTEEGYVISCRDISDKIANEIKLMENEEKFSTLFASMSEMVVIHDLILDKDGNPVNYRITDSNKQFTKTTGITQEEAVGKLASVLYQSDPPPYLADFARATLSGEGFEYSTYYEPMNKHFLISVVPMGRNRFATVTTDITTIRQTQEMIKEKNKELENYLYVASHDLRSPLVNIQGFSQRVQKQTDNIRDIINANCTDSELHQQLDEITESAIPKSLNFIFSNVAKMDSLIKGLLQISRTGRIRMEIKETDISEIINKITEAASYEMESANVQFTVEPLPNCQGDQNLLNQLFSNLLSNALKYRDPDRKLEIEITGKKQFNNCIYTVRDNGIGISKHNLNKIWDVFYRVDPSSGIPGEGIGLNIVRRIVEKHQGRIEVSSEEGTGTTFRITLPNIPFEEDQFSDS